MIIVGFIVHTLPERCSDIEKTLSRMTGISTHGVHNTCYIVAVMEAPSGTLEHTMDSIKKIEGVLACYVTSLHNENETEPHGIG